MKLQPLAFSVAIALAATPFLTRAESAASSDDNVTETIEVRGSYLGSDRANSFKTPTLLIDTPQSISLISREQMDDQNFMDMADILLYTPGASIGQGENHRDQFTIRGQNTTADFFVDGLRDDVQYFRPLYNLESVEILRGANAMLFGRGGGGGVINRVTKTADVKASFNSVSANINTFGAGMISADNNIALSDDQAVRINTLYEQFDSHRDFNDGERFAINPTFTWNASDDTSVLLSYEYVNDDRFVDRGVPSLNGRPLDNARDTFFGDRDINETTFEAHIARARVDHKLSDDWSLNATVQAADYDKFYANMYPVGFDGETQRVTFDGYNDTQDRNSILAQFNVVGQVSTGNIEHTLLMGFEYADQRSTNVRQEAIFPNGATSEDGRPALRDSVVFSDPIVAPLMQFSNPIRDTSTSVTVSSAFIQDEIALNEEWTLMLGARFDRFEIDVLDFIQIGVENGTINPEDLFSSEAYAAIADDGNNGVLGSDDNHVSPRVGVIYQPLDSLSFYASYSESFLPRSGDQFLSLNLTSESLEAEEFENREIGVKWDIMPALSFTAAVFELERKNASVVDPANPERANLADTETRGFEMQIVGYITDDWTINAGYSYLDAEEEGRIRDGQAANRELAQVPEHMASVWTRYNTSEDLGFGVGVTHQGAQFTSLSNAVEMPSFTRVDAAVFYTVSEDLDVQLNIENLFDKEYFPAAHNDNNITTGEPLNARVSVNYRF